MKPDRPGKIPPKQRAPRGSRQRRDYLSFTRTQVDRMLKMAKAANDQEMIAVLAPKRPLAVCKKELLSSIRRGKVERDLWDAYEEAVIAAQTGGAGTT